MFDLSNWFLLYKIPQEDKTDIIASFPEARAYKKGETIYSGDEFERALGVILSGFASAHGENVLKKTFMQGDTFGAAALFGSGNEYISEITAKTDCLIQLVDENTLKKLFLKYPEISINYISFLSDKVRFLNRKISIFTCKSASMRLYRYFLDNADENNSVKVPNMTSLARLTSIGRTSLYRAMDELAENGYISRDGSSIIIK
ncbi:MAG: Crp/Fnr family transcriptional regulator [Clostridiales bacterium]|nr:Crp/Fnr family transcriptional regulator [Clostridiales bacterium]